MITGRVGAGGGADGPAARQRFLEWLDGGQELAAELARLCEDLEQERTTSETVGAELQRLRGELADAHGDRAEAEAERARLEAEVARLAAALSDATVEAETLRQQNAGLMAERGETAKLIADKLEDMLVQVLPRLGRASVLPAEPAPRGPATDAAARPAGGLAPAARSASGTPPLAPAGPGADAAAAAAPAPGAPAATAAAAWQAAAEEAAAAEPEPAGALDPAEEPEPRGARIVLGDPPRVLIVDDEGEFATLLGDHLGTSGYEVRAAASGEQALALLPDFEPDVVLLDMMMAGIGGMETLRRIRASRPESAVIMITALDDRDVARKALAAGAVDYLTKPLSLDLLNSALTLHAGGPAPLGVPPVREPMAVAAPSRRRTFFARA